MSELVRLLKGIRGGLGPLDGVVNTEDIDRAIELAEQPREYGVALIPYGKEKWRYPRLHEYGDSRTGAEETLHAIQTAQGVAAKAKIVSRTKAGQWENEN